MRSKSGTKKPRAHWLVLVHQLPPKPAYNRVKIWRRLQDVGAISLKNSVYVLPCTGDARALFTGIIREIEHNGGEAILYEADLVAGMRDDQLRAYFNAARDADYLAVTAELRNLAQAIKKAKRSMGEPIPALIRLDQRLAELSEIDFFGASGRATAEALLAELEHSAIVRTDVARTPPTALDMAGKVWVTRRDIRVDRIACAWLIKRFIDPRAELKFVSAKQYEPHANEFRYDMQDGEFTHEGDKCTFEVLVLRARISDPALKAIAEIIHDIDLKDGKFGHPQTAGIAHIISGTCRTYGDDEDRLARGKDLFDDIYEQFRRGDR